MLNNYPINKYINISILDELWREYILLNNRIYSAVCGDASNIVLDEVIHVLKKHVDILCYKVQPLTLAGKNNGSDFNMLMNLIGMKEILLDICIIQVHMVIGL